MKFRSRSLLIALPALALSASPAFASPGPNPAVGWDDLWFHVLVDIFAIGIVFAIGAVYMMVRYRSRGPGEVGRAPRLTRGQALAWALVPTAIFVADDFYLAGKGWSLFEVYRNPPADAMEVKVTGYQWYWEFDYGNGVVKQELKVPVGKAVVLRMIGSDVVHSFALTDFRVKEDVMPGRVTYLWFRADKPIKTQVTCTMYCGLNHSRMFAPVEAVPPEQFHAWLDDQTRLAHAAAGNGHNKI